MITGMKVYKFVAMLATIVLALALVMELVGARRSNELIICLVLLSANLGSYWATTQKVKHQS